MTCPEDGSSVMDIMQSTKLHMCVAQLQPHACPQSLHAASTAAIMLLVCMAMLNLLHSCLDNDSFKPIAMFKY